MKASDVEKLEKVTGQLEGMHKEITLLGKKAPNDALNSFKLKMLNAALASANSVLGKRYKPIEDFSQFDADDVPSNSDATVVLAGYLEELERLRSDNIKSFAGIWRYDLEDESNIRTAAPRKLKDK